MKKPISATIEEDLIAWIQDQVSVQKKFRNKSHLIESALEYYKEKEGKNGRR